MVIIDPYNTTYGRFINKEKIVKAITNYLHIHSNKHFNYEFPNNDQVKYVFILGCNQEEKSFPIWEQPMLFNIGTTAIIAVDLRKYVKAIKDQPVNIYSVVKDKPAVDYLATAAMLMGDFYIKNYSPYRKIFTNISTAYAFLSSYIINIIIALNPLEKLKIEIASSYVANMLLTHTEANESLSMFKDSIIARISTSKLSLPVNKEIIKGFNFPDALDPNIEAFIKYYQTVISEDKGSLITDKVYINLLSNLWFGPGGNETLIMAMECMPLFIALVFSLVNDTTYKRQKLATLFSTYDKHIKRNEIINVINQTITSKITALQFEEINLDDILE